MADFSVSNEGNIAVLNVSGRIDPENWKTLKEALTRQIDENPKGTLLVDLEKLEYIASAGFRELFLAGRNLHRGGGTLAVCSLQGEVKRVFQLAGFATAYPIFDTKEAALAHFRSL